MPAVLAQLVRRHNFLLLNPLPVAVVAVTGNLVLKVLLVVVPLVLVLRLELGLLVKVMTAHLIQAETWAAVAAEKAALVLAKLVEPEYLRQLAVRHLTTLVAVAAVIMVDLVELVAPVLAASVVPYLALVEMQPQTVVVVAVAVAVAVRDLVTAETVDLVLSFFLCQPRQS
jgi:hypothetical protein